MDAGADPRVSVLLTVFNGLPYLEQAIDSILAQTFDDFEFVIVDDGSTDGTPQFLDAIEDQRVRILTRPNGGTAAAANQGLASCRGEFIARMDADDISTPDRLALQVAYLDSHLDVGMVGSFTQSLGESRLGGIVPLPTEHDDIVAALRDGRHALSHPSLLIRANVLRDAGGYWGYRLIDDWDMMLRVSEITTVNNLPLPLLQYRVHRGSLNGSAMDRMRFSIDFARARADARERGDTEPDLEAFTAMHKNRPRTVRLSDAANAMSLSHYRLAVAERNGPSPIRAVPHLFAAGALRPDLVVQRLIRQIKAR